MNHFDFYIMYNTACHTEALGLKVHLGTKYLVNAFGFAIEKNNLRSIIQSIPKFQTLEIKGLKTGDSINPKSVPQSSIMWTSGLTLGTRNLEIRRSQDPPTIWTRLFYREPSEGSAIFHILTQISPAFATLPMSVLNYSGHIYLHYLRSNSAFSNSFRGQYYFNSDCCKK